VLNFVFAACGAAPAQRQQRAAGTRCRRKNTLAQKHPSGKSQIAPPLFKERRKIGIKLFPVLGTLSFGEFNFSLLEPWGLNKGN
jgi:hypothetical protein